MMRLMRRLASVLAVCALVAACGNAPPPSRPASAATPSAITTASPVDQPVQPVDVPSASPTSCGGADQAVDRGPYVIAGMEVPGFFANMGAPGWQKDDLAVRQVVVVGRVVAQEAAAYGGEAGVYTPFAVEVDEVIHGKASLGTLRVSTEGGTVGCYSVDVDTAPHLQEGGRYVFFLTGSALSDPPPEVWDVWMVDNHDIVSTYQGPMSLTQLVDRIDRLAAAASSPSP